MHTPLPPKQTSPAARLWSGCGQFALSVLDVEATVAFYERVFGYARNGGYDRLFNGAITDKILAHKGVRHRLRWLSDQDPGFQLELVQFQSPPARPRALATRPWDLGYSRMTLWLENFDQVLARLCADQVLLLTEPRDFGEGRRVCCRDPNGILVELLERDVAPSGARPPRSYNLPVRTRAITLSVASLVAAESYFEGCLGLQRADLILHTPPMEELWGGRTEAAPRSSLFWAGDHLLELVQYAPAEPRQAPWVLGDVGLYHFALRFDGRRAVDDTYGVVQSAGFGSNSAPADLRIANLVYLDAPGGSWVECLYFHPWLARFVGYRRQAWR